MDDFVVVDCASWLKSFVDDTGTLWLFFEPHHPARFDPTVPAASSNWRMNPALRAIDRYEIPYPPTPPKRARPGAWLSE